MRTWKSCQCALWVCLLVLVVLVSQRPVAAASDIERSLFRTASSVVDVANMRLAELHDAAGFCPWILVAYSDGCGHCRSAAPDIIKRAQDTFDSAEDLLHEFTVAALNCHGNTDICRDLGVTGVPTFFLLTPSWLAMTQPTLSPITLKPRSDAATQNVSATSQVLTRILIGRGGGVDTHLDLTRNIWGPMANASWSAQNRERCIDMRNFLRNAKQNDIKKAAAGAAAAEQTTFVEERDFHSVDVANAFFYTLYHEVALVGLDSVERRYALNRFVRAVQQRLPGLGADVLLHEMADHTNVQGEGGNQADFTAFTVAEWQKLVVGAAIPYRGTPRDLTWLTCRGSSWRYRGFPCGMWLLYHALTANAAASHTAPDGANAGAGAVDNTEILFVIKDYARNFFSCETCRNNFMRFSPNREEDPVWQLWKVHNVVNYHLSSVTEGADPLVPKRQFPGPELCASCYRDTPDGDTKPESKVVMAEMIQFLRSRYRWVPSSLRDSPTISASPASPGANEQVITVYKTPMTLNVVLTMAVVIVVVLCAMQYVLRRSRAQKAKRHRPILPLRMQP